MKERSAGYRGQTFLEVLHDLDATFTDRVHVPPGHPLRPLVVVGAHLGDGPLWLLLWGLGLWYWRPDAPRFQGILAWVASAVLAAVVTYGIKFTVRRPRPREVGGFYSRRYDAHAFPSGHATRMGTVALWGSLLFPQWALLFWAVSLWCILSRAALGVHYLGDVVVGFLVGMSVSLLLWIVIA